MKGYPNDLYILAFDHRGTLTKGLLGVEGRPPEKEEKDLILEILRPRKGNEELCSERACR